MNRSHLRKAGTKMDFNEKAQTWDNDVRARRAAIIAEEIKKVIADRKYKKALEFGCGTGLISFNMGTVLSDITLVDSAERMIHVLEDKIGTCGCTHMTPLHLDIEKGQKLPGKYDLVYMSMALHHIVDIENLLRQLNRGMEIGARLCIVDLAEEDGSFHKSEAGFKGHNGFDPAALGHLLQKIGFTGMDSKNIYSDVKKTGEAQVPYSLFLLTAVKKNTPADIRKMTIEDYDAVHKMWIDTEGVGLRSLDDAKAGIEMFLERNPNTNFVAVSDRKIVGATLSGHDGRRGYLYHTSVRPAFRGQGIGTALVESVYQAMQAEGINRIALIVKKQNDVGNAFWKSLDWEKRVDLNYYNRSLNDDNR
jgi:ribosomal protein S18 acetylase RimI-like enzyme/ubiquinone/menaquinone biosynthesis C-methylase UbiE